MIVKQRRSQVKRCGCLFTCLTSRGIHIEVAMNLKTDAFISALHRFLSKRGPVLHFFFDNGSNFVSADRPFMKPCASKISMKLKIFSFKKNSMGFHSSKCQPHKWCLGENDSVGQTNFNFIDDGINSRWPPISHFLIGSRVYFIKKFSTFNSNYN